MAQARSTPTSRSRRSPEWWTTAPSYQRISHTRRRFKNYIKALGKGLLKIFAKMGISTLASYRGAQIFEAVGVRRDVVDEFFSETASRIGGVGLKTIAEEAGRRHERAYPVTVTERERAGTWGGQYQWRRNGERHLLDPKTIHTLQQATRTDDYELYKRYAQTINDQSKSLFTIRGMLRFKKRDPIPLEDVEPIEDIMRRFCTGAMSFGSISAEAHETLAIAMNRIGGKSNSGEGGEDPARFTPDPNGDSRRSAIKQVASGPALASTSWYLTNAKELQIKVAQGAKPGEGGQLPGHKVNRTIARVRSSTPGVGLISPPPHHDIYSIEDLASADPRSQELEPERGHQRQACICHGRRHDRSGRLEGPRGVGPDRRRLRRHGRLAANVDQARRGALGDRALGNPAGPRDERSAGAGFAST